MAQVPEGDGAVLELKIDFERGADANQSGLILSRLSSAYSKHCRGIGVRNARLIVRRVEISSLFAVLEGVVDVVKGARVLYDSRQLIGSFAQELAGAIATIHSGNPELLPSYMRSLIRALIAPMRQKKASRTSIKVAGPNGGLLEIDTSDAKVIEQVLAMGGHVLLGQGPTLPNPAEKHRLMEPPPRTSIVSSSIAGLPRIDLSRGPKLHATLVHTLGTWYARPATLNGTMLPAEIASAAAGIDLTGTYLVSGHLFPPHGPPERFQIYSVDRRLS